MPPRLCYTTVHNGGILLEARVFWPHRRFLEELEKRKADDVAMTFDRLLDELDARPYTLRPYTTRLQDELEPRYVVSGWVVTLHYDPGSQINERE
jgi:hypothetical protein